MSLEPPVTPTAPGPPPVPPPAPHRPPASDPTWPAWTAPLALFTALGMTLFGGAVVAIVSASTSAHRLSDLPPAARIVSVALQDLALIAAAVLFAATTGRPRAWQFGLR